MRARFDQPVGEIQRSHRPVELQSISEARSVARQCLDQSLVAIGRRRHVAHGVGDLVDLPPDLVGGIKEDHVQLDVEALDGRANPRGPRSDHDHIVE